MNPTTDTAAAAIAVISTNMLQQIIALQEVINSREPQQRFPTMQEAGLLTKMISALEKLKRFLAPPKQPAQERTNTRKRVNKQAEPIAEEGDTNPMPETGDATHPLLAAISDTPANQPSAPQNATDLPHPPTPLQKPLASSHPEDIKFPIEEHEFTDYQHLFDNMRLDRGHTTMVKGFAYNTNWLQYNLYQYSLPQYQRRFYYMESRYHQEIVHENIIWLIQNYLRLQRR